MSHTISPQTRVTLFFSLSLADGQIIDSNFAGNAAHFVPGDGSLLPAFEACVLGLRVGDKRQFLVPAAEAFGLRQDANLKRVPRERFAGDIDLVPGLVVSFAAAEGGELPGVIHRLMGDMIEVDFNHPLAGRDIVFDVEIIAVESAAAIKEEG
jgi:FKBP-type peptidyl-prolyl cis-trans isomerase SlpA